MLVKKKKIILVLLTSPFPSFYFLMIGDYVIKKLIYGLKFSSNTSDLLRNYMYSNSGILPSAILIKI